MQRQLITLVLFLLFSIVNAQVVPDGFIVEEVVRGLDPTHMALAPDGRIFIAEKNGRILIIRDDQLNAEPFLNIEVDNFNERGLSGIAFDPDFEQNNYIYVYYTVPNANHNRVSRFVANGDFAIPGSEEILLDLDPLAGTIHNAGAMMFGSDGKLYIAVGDGADANAAQELNNLLGKILRINADGTIPQDNPFYNQLTGNNRAIYAYGLRNPFSFSINSNTGDIFANDVGQATWEEVNNILPGGNYGWPLIEGPIESQNPPDNYVDPLYAYTHDQGCAIVGATFYTPETLQFPSNYENKYFFADYCGGYIKVLDPGSGVVEETFASQINRPLTMVVSPDGTLYFLERAGQGGGSQDDNTSTEDGALWKVTYNGSGAPFIGNQPDDILISIGESATFEISASGTQPLQYQWKKDGSDIANATMNNYTFENAQLSDSASTFTCVVSNAFGSVESEGALLKVTSNQRPNPMITTPSADLKYRGGNTIQFSGVATDPEDGDLDPSGFTWWVDFHHDEHTHPVLAPFQAAAGEFEVPRVGEISSNVWYRIYLSAEDANGMSRTVYTEVFPYKSFITYNTSPQGLSVNVDGRIVETPFATESVVGITRTVEALPSQELGNQLFVFDGWDDGSPELIRSFNAPELDTVINLTYTEVSKGSGTGLLGHYFAQQEKTFLGSPIMERLDSVINFDWGGGSPFIISGISSDNFTIRWQGEIQPIFTGEHIFYTVSDDGVRLNVADTLVIDQWIDQPATEWNGKVYLEAGQSYPIKLEYYENGGAAVIRLFWKAPMMNKQIVPKSQLYPSNITSVDLIENKFQVYPNPADQFIRVQADREINQIIIHDIRGKEYLRVDQPGKSAMINVEELPPGIYLVKSVIGGKMRVDKIVK